jgi:hypothetical protein
MDVGASNEVEARESEGQTAKLVPVKSPSIYCRFVTYSEEYSRHPEIGELKPD